MALAIAVTLAALGGAGDPLRAPVQASTPTETIERAVVDAVRSVCDCDSAQVVRVESRSVLDAAAALDGVSVHVISPAMGYPEAPDRYRVLLEGRREGRAVTLNLTASARCFGRALLAERNLPAGCDVAAADLSWQDGFFAPALLWRGAAPALPAYAPLGLRRGEPLAPDALRARPLVRRGEPVVVRTAGSGFELRGLGVARAHGWCGDRVAVRLNGATRDVSGQVAPDGTVEVALENVALRP